MMQKTIYYWEAIIGQDALVSEYNEKLKRLLSGEYKGLSLDLKKIPGYRVYSIRLNHSDRLLFTLLTSSDGKTYLVLLEKISNHDYQKSRFLKPNILKQFLEAQGEAIVKQVREVDFKEIENLPCANSHDDDSELSFLRVEYYKDTFIALNEDQLNATQCYNALPLIIAGPPGAGKSCVALNIFSQCSEQHAESNKPILLVTRNSHLKTNLHTIFAATHPDLDPKRIHIKTYDELLAELTQKDQFIGKDDFRQWLKSYLERNAFPAKKVPSIDAIYNEFGIVDVCEANYLQLGTNESLFTDAHERKWLLQAYQEYRYKYLANRINPDFYPVAQKSLYACIVADESQNFTPRQLQVLVALANGQNCFCLDTNQATEDVQSKRAFIAKLFYELDISLQEKQLPIAYRCPMQVNRVINALLKTKYKLTGGKVDKQQYGLIELAATQARQGSVQWWEPELSVERRRLLSQLAGSVGFAIVTLPEFVAEVRAMVATPLVFTPSQVGGLEYNTIFAYRLFDQERFKEINKKLANTTGDEQEKESINRPKNKDLTAMLDAPQFNEVFIAFSRACENLIICQADKHEIKYLLDPIRKQISDVTGKAIAMLESSTADWEEHRKLQLASGNVEQAQMIQAKLEDTADEGEKITPPVMSSSSSSSSSSFVSSSTAKNSIANAQQKKLKDKKLSKNVKKKGRNSDKQNQLTPRAVVETQTREDDIRRLAGHLLSGEQAFSETFSQILEFKPAFCKLIDLFASRDESWLRFIFFFWGYLNNFHPSHSDKSLQTQLHSDVANLGLILQDEKCKIHLNTSERGKIFLSLITLLIVELKIRNSDLSFPMYFTVYTRLLNNTYTNNISYEHFQTILTLAVGKPNSSWVLSARPKQVVRSGRSHTMLHEAVERGDTSIAELLCYYHTHIDQLNEQGESALFIAVNKGNLAIVEMLLRRAALPNIPDGGSNPLLIAVGLAIFGENHVQIMRSLLKSKMMKLVPIGHAVLFAAASSHKEGVLEAVLAAGCDVKQLEPKENRNAIFAAIEVGRTDSVVTLFKHGCDLNHADINGCTPLAIAITSVNVKAVTFFLQHRSELLNTKLKLTRQGLNKLSGYRYSSQLLEAITSKYLEEVHIHISPLELATELKIEAMLTLIAKAQGHSQQSSVPPAGIGFFTSNTSFEETAKRDGQSDHDHGYRKE